MVNILLLITLTFAYRAVGSLRDYYFFNLLISFIFIPIALPTFNFRVISSILPSLFLTLIFLSSQYVLFYYLLSDNLGEHNDEYYLLVLILSYLIATGYSMILNWCGINMFFIKKENNLSKRRKVINVVIMFFMFCLFLVFAFQSGKYDYEIRKSFRETFNLPISE